MMIKPKMDKLIDRIEGNDSDLIKDRINNLKRETDSLFDSFSKKMITAEYYIAQMTVRVEEMGKLEEKSKTTRLYKKLSWDFMTDEMKAEFVRERLDRIDFRMARKSVNNVVPRE